VARNKTKFNKSNKMPIQIDIERVYKECMGCNSEQWIPLKMGGVN